MTSFISDEDLKNSWAFILTRLHLLFWVSSISLRVWTCHRINKGSGINRISTPMLNSSELRFCDTWVVHISLIINFPRPRMSKPRSFENNSRIHSARKSIPPGTEWNNFEYTTCDHVWTASLVPLLFFDLVVWRLKWAQDCTGPLLGRLSFISFISFVFPYFLYATGREARRESQSV